MNKFFCFLTGGHMYPGEPGAVVDDNKNKRMTFYVNCEKCGQLRKDTLTYRQLGFPAFMCEGDGSLPSYSQEYEKGQRSAPSTTDEVDGPPPAVNGGGATLPRPTEEK